MLAWWRTALAAIGFSLAVMQLAKSTAGNVIGIAGLLFGAFCFVVGGWRYHQMRKQICATTEDSPPDCP